MAKVADYLHVWFEKNNHMMCAINRRNNNARNSESHQAFRKGFVVVKKTHITCLLLK